MPELSRRARGLPTWAALKSLGRSGIVELVGRHCALARQMAQALAATPGIRVMNDVVLNQIVVQFGTEGDGSVKRKALAMSVIELLVEEGEIFVAGASWRGEWVMRISIICGATTTEDAKAATAAIKSAWARVSAAPILLSDGRRP